MLEQLQQAYTNSRWFRYGVYISVPGSAILLYFITGGFPPAAWHLLFQALTELPWLWSQHGTAIIIPLIGLIALSLTILLFWCLLLYLTVVFLYQCWQEYQEQQQFNRALEKAEELSSKHVRQLEGDEINDPTIQTTQHIMATRSLAEAPTLPSLPSLPTTPLPSTTLPPRLRPSFSPTPPQKRPAPPPPSPSRTEKLVASEAPHLRNGHSRVTSPSLSASVAEKPAPVRLEEKNEDYELEIFEGTHPHAVPSLPGQNITISIGTVLDPGLKRKGKPNEDSLIALQATRTCNGAAQSCGLFVVADGMGGHANGQEASNLAIRTFSDSVMPTVLHASKAEQDFLHILTEAAHKANTMIIQRNHEQVTENFMGTTLTAGLVIDTTAYIVNVGDSRTYLYRQSDGLTQITRDHSAVARMIEAGALQPDEVYTHPRRNEIYRCLGDTDAIKIDTFTLPLQSGDILLLCSDGLWEMVRDPDIAHILTIPTDPTRHCQQLLQAALNGGGKDNISAIVVHVH